MTIIYNLIITVLLISAFFMCLTAYWVGFKHGKSVTNGITPPTKVKDIMRKVAKPETKADEAQINEGIQNILNYDVDVALDHIKRKGR